MIQAEERKEAEAGLAYSRPNPRRANYFLRHTQDVSDASIAEFERLMAAMGFRQREPSSRSTFGAS